MAVEIFFKLDGVDGESEKDSHVKEMEVHGFSLSADNQSSVAFGTGSGAGKVDISGLHLQRQVDNASTKLFQLCCNGKHTAKGKLTVREAGGDKPVDFLTYDLEEVFIEHISWGGTAGGGKPSENVKVTFKKIVQTYYPQLATGAQGTKMVGGWDIGKGTAAAA
jgi:type VI secretion system secreted protein Hcp